MDGDIAGRLPQSPPTPISWYDSQKRHRDRDCVRVEGAGHREVVGFLVTRLAIGAITLFVVTVVVFFLINSAPGGPVAIMSTTGTAGERAALSKMYGLDRPVPVR